MDKRKRRVVLTLAMLLAVVPGFSQDNSGSNPPPNQPGNGSQSTSQSSGSASSTLNYTAGGRSYVTAAPGSIPGIFPAYAPENGQCYVYALTGFPALTQAVINSMAKGGKLPRGLHVTVINPDAGPAYDGPIGLVTYSPRGTLNEGDQYLGSVIAPGVYHHPDEQLLGVALRELKKRIPATRRVGIIDCPEAESVTKANTFGIGGTNSYTPGSGADASSIALGFSHGTSKGSKQMRSTFYVYALNDGPLNLPKPIPPAPAPQAPPPPPVVQQAPPPPAPTPQAVATPPPPPPPVVDQCILPEIEIHFGFDCDDVFKRCVKGNETEEKHKARAEANQKAIRTGTDWLEQHQSCKVLVRGSACIHGSADYNAGLGLRRAHAVYAILMEDTKIQGQVIESVSKGKDDAAAMDHKYSERHEEDRKIILVVRGSDSAKK